MLKSLWQKFTSKEAMPSAREVILNRDHHNVSRRLISRNALKVMSRLHGADYDAYLVGGGVRDILLERQPKDFDIATNATPEQIKALFRNCRIIGRRFRLAHIMFGREIIEVATFRADHQDDDKRGKQHASGMLLRDNVYGDIEQDALRRDFTINALYYSSADFSVRDYVGGLTDLKKRQLRLIGNPIQRYQEDPVRMLRAVRLAVKLDLKIEQHTAAAIAPNATLLEQVSNARLWDESHKLLLAGHALNTWQALADHSLLASLLPATARCLAEAENDRVERLIEAALNNTDRRIQQEKPVTPAFLYAVFLWYPLVQSIQYWLDQGVPYHDAFGKAAHKVLQAQQTHIAIPKRFSLVIREMWAMQPRLEKRTPRAFKLIEQPRFRASYDLLCLRAKAEPHLQELADWWTEFQEVPAEQQKQMVNRLQKPQHKRRRNSRSRRRVHKNQPRNSSS